MTDTRKARVPLAEQSRLINECRKSGMTDNMEKTDSVKNFSQI